MSFDSILQGLTPVAMGFMVWWVKDMWNKQQKQEDTLGDLRQKLAESYVSRREYMEQMGNFNAKLDRVLDKLEGKLDKDEVSRWRRNE